MSGRASNPSIPGVVTLFTLAGPFVAGVLAPLMFFLVGPLGLLLYPVYLIFWIPSFYTLLAPPFCLAGLLYALATRRLQPRLVFAVAASLAGFSLYLGVRLLATGSVSARTPAHIDFATDVATAFGVVLLVLAATTACWYLIRRCDRLLRALRIAGWPPPLRRVVRVLGAAVTIGVVGNAIALSRPPPPETAWDRCIKPDRMDQQILDCSTVFEAATEPPERRFQALQNRIQAYVELASVTSPDSDKIVIYDHLIEDAETAQRSFGANEAIHLAYGHLHRGQSEKSRNDIAQARADFDVTIRLDGEGVLGKQARLEKTQLLMQGK